MGGMQRDQQRRGGSVNRLHLVADDRDRHAMGAERTPDLCSAGADEWQRVVQIDGELVAVANPRRRVRRIEQADGDPQPPAERRQRLFRGALESKLLHQPLGLIHSPWFDEQIDIRVSTPARTAEQELIKRRSLEQDRGHSLIRERGRKSRVLDIEPEGEKRAGQTASVSLTASPAQPLFGRSVPPAASDTILP
jgi:hypothetical protein